jgi:phytoene/squalene synthetase
MSARPRANPGETGEGYSPQTGYERYTSSGEISSIQTQIRLFFALIERAFKKREIGYAQFAVELNRHHLLRLLERISKVYPGILNETAMAVLALPDGLKRLEVLNKIYLASRILDDAVDGDSPNKLSADEIVDFVGGVGRNFESGNWNRRNVVDVFYSQAMEVCQKIGLDIKQQVLTVIHSLKFDAKRRADFMKTGQRHFYPQNELERNYYKLDIEGTVGACLEITNEGDTAENKRIVEPLGRACRIFYDIRDLAIEVKDGLVNITAEDAARFGIEMEELSAWAAQSGDLIKAPEGVKDWAGSKTEQGKILVREFEELIAASNFKPLTRSILKKSFLAQCKPFLEKTGQSLNSSVAA